MNGTQAKPSLLGWEGFEILSEKAEGALEEIPTPPSVPTLAFSVSKVQEKDN